jgi:MFS family permease
MNSDITSKAYMWTRLLNSPFWGIYSLLPTIIYKDLGATALDIAILTAIRPLVSLLSLYLGAALEKRREWLIPGIVLATILGHLPFMFCPFIDHPSYFILAFGLYIGIARGIVPGWMEVLKLNVPETSRGHVVSLGSLMGYLGNCFLPLVFGYYMDLIPGSWRIVFPITALISCLSILFQMRISIPKGSASAPIPLSLTGPWKTSFEILKRRDDFRFFQIGFMFGGAGLMVMQPALQIYLVDIFKLNYMEITIATCFFKGLGFLIASPFFSNAYKSVTPFYFGSVVTGLAIFFPLFFLQSAVHIGFLYLSYFIYGVMQAGSELIWHLSGPLFSRDEDSTAYSNVNVLTVGIRGAFAPLLGCCLSSYLAPFFALVFGGALCLIATERFLSYHFRKVFEPSLK